MKFVIDEDASILKEEPEMFDLLLVDPSDFLVQTTSPEVFKNGRLTGCLHKEDSLCRLMDRLEKGLPITPPYIIVNITSGNGKITQHEGRHRAIACIEKGIEKMPLLIFYEKWVENPKTFSGMEFYHIKAADVPKHIRGNLRGFRHQWM